MRHSLNTMKESLRKYVNQKVEFTTKNMLDWFESRNSISIEEMLESIIEPELDVNNFRNYWVTAIFKI